MCHVECTTLFEVVMSVFIEESTAQVTANVRQLPDNISP